MRRLKLSLKVAVIVALFGVSMIGQTTTLFEIPFSDTLPFTTIGHGGTPSNHDADVHDGAGPTCSGSVHWNYERIASGGYGNAPYMRYTFCDYDTSPQSSPSGDTGWFGASAGYAPAGGYQDIPYYFRFRIYFDSGLIPDANNGGDVDHSFKFLIMHRGSVSGDRMMIFFQSGDTVPDVGAHGGDCRGNRLTQICISIQRNINHGTQAAYFLVPVGQWNHLQFAWKHGATNVAYLKGYLNQNVEANPTTVDTLDTAWPFQAAGYQAQYDLAGMANQGTQLEDPWHYRLQDVEFGNGFSTNWFPGGADTTDPVPTIATNGGVNYGTTSTPATIAGTCTDDTSVASVTWTNSGGGSGTAAGTSNWTFNSALAAGANGFTVTCTDGAGNDATDGITVTYTPPPPAGNSAIPDLPRRVR